MEHILVAFAYLMAGIGARGAAEVVGEWIIDQREQELELSRLREPQIQHEQYTRSRKLEWQECFEELTERIRERNQAMMDVEYKKRVGATPRRLATALEQKAMANYAVTDALQRIRDLDAV